MTRENETTPAPCPGHLCLRADGICCPDDACDIESGMYAGAVNDMTGEPGALEGRSETPWRVDDLVALINQMAYRLRKVDPASPWPDRATDYLRREGLMPSPLREGSAPKMEPNLKGSHVHA